jgi:hypothetical protein
VSSRLPETPPPPPTTLPAAQIVLEAYWHVGRHLRTYAAQIFVLSAVTWFVLIAMNILVSLVLVRASVGVQTAAQQLVFVVAVVTVLLMGGTAIFIDCQRAIVFGLSPAIGHALKLRPGETRVLRAVCIYWLIVHLVPTLVVNISYVAAPLQLDWAPQLPVPANFAFYWAWVLATAPLVVMSLPIVLFESAPSPLAAGRQRLDGNGGRMFVAGALAFAPLAVAEIGIYMLRASTGPFDNSPALFWLVDVVLINVLQFAISFAAILVMSALVAVAYMRLSPRIESVYRVFD